ARGGEREALRLAEPAAGAGDDRDPPVQAEAHAAAASGRTSFGETARPSSAERYAASTRAIVPSVVRPEISGSASSWIARISWPIVPLNACGNQRSSQRGRSHSPSSERVVHSIVLGLPTG